MVDRLRLVLDRSQHQADASEEEHEDDYQIESTHPFEREPNAGDCSDDKSQQRASGQRPPVPFGRVVEDDPGADDERNQDHPAGDVEVADCEETTAIAMEPQGVQEQVAAADAHRYSEKKRSQATRAAPHTTRSPWSLIHHAILKGL